MASGLLVLPGVEPALGDSGAPVNGATLTVKIAGSATLASLFADAALATPITNPQTSNSAGRFFQQSSTIFADASQTYDCTLSYPSTGQTFTFDGIPLVGTAVDISGLAPINSPNFTGVPTAPTPALNDNSQKIATTAFVKGQGYATLASPAFTGTPTAPTAAVGTNTTQLATTAFVVGTNSLATPGYAEFSSGLIIQWGRVTGVSDGSTVTVTFPITMAAVLECYASTWSDGSSTANAGAQTVIGTLTTSGVHIKLQNFAANAGPNQDISWLVLGTHT